VRSDQMTGGSATVSPQRPQPSVVAPSSADPFPAPHAGRLSASQAIVNTRSNTGAHNLAGGDHLLLTSCVSQSTPDVAEYRHQNMVAESKRFYFPELDILRFCAFLMVFLCHTITPSLESGPYGHFFMMVKAVGALGVPVFFFLSAYLITELLVIEKEKTGHINIRNFYVRRILRIWPLYFLFLGTAYAIGRLLSSYHLPAAAIPYYLLLGGNWWKGASGYAGPLWTISVEEQFYLIWPTLANQMSSKALAFVSAGIWVSSQLALSLFSYWHLPIGKYVLPNSFVQFQFFALGALTALLLKSERPNLSAATRTAIVSAGIVCFFLAEYLFYATVRERDASLLTIPGFWLTGLGVVLLFLGISGARPPVMGRPLVYLGKISYGLYIFHLLVRNLVISVATRLRYHQSVYALDWLVALPLTIVVAHYSYRFFESRFLLLKERFTVVKSRGV
jgi:peptidoglycan/LPS O-acetylase OafA/YrhL